MFLTLGRIRRKRWSGCNYSFHSFEFFNLYIQVVKFCFFCARLEYTISLGKIDEGYPSSGISVKGMTDLIKSDFKFFEKCKVNPQT